MKWRAGRKHSLAANMRKDFADRSVQDRVGDIVERSRLGVDDHDAGACFSRAGDCARDRINLQAAADCEQEIGFERRIHCTLDDLRNERLTEGDRVALQHSVT